MELTLVNSSPLSKNSKNFINEAHQLCYKDYSILKDEVRNFLNPKIRSLDNSCIIFALPMEWYDYLMKQKNSKYLSDYEKLKYTNFMIHVGHEIFPKISLDKTIININTKNITDTAIGFSMWLEFYELPLNLRKSKRKNKLDLIQITIMKYLRHTGMERFPFTFAISYSLMSIAKIRLIRDKLALKITKRCDKPPLFTIHLQDEKSPFVLLWMDTENVCSFNIEALNTPSAYVNFANTMIMFINFSMPEVRSI
ncbi:hypothetical protein C6P40_003187 [Pichia californica]|uniref:Uncharacterized protein n=1 Tax=Pichia californica TaxID=460514 RepID=A0A9P7BF23_9ASCO|nr:hypothetical protein C6P40_003187 [[Candida] californica]